MKTSGNTILTILSGFCLCMMSACTTVDLSQVSFEKTQQPSSVHAQNVVERASKTMVALFESRGWCKTSPKEKTQTAASVLLNGMDMDAQTPSLTMSVSATQLSKDLGVANDHVKQTTKAAEVFLATAEEIAELGQELSLLEAALLSAREAEHGFEDAMILSTKSLSERHQSEFEDLQFSIKQLKTVTDAYGERMRAQISARSERAHS